jgi:hypothetical protein
MWSNGFCGDVFLRETDEFCVCIPPLPRPTLECVQSRFPYVRRVEADNSPEEAVILSSGTLLGKGERISGAQYELRLNCHRDLLLGYQQAVWLEGHQDEYPSLMRWVGEVYIDFPGMIVLETSGNRSILCLSNSGKRWRLCWIWLSFPPLPRGRVATNSLFYL